MCILRVQEIGHRTLYVNLFTLLFVSMAKNDGYHYSRLQVAFQIAFRILVRTYVMLFCNYPTSNEFTPRNLQLCPQTSKLGSELRPSYI